MMSGYTVLMLAEDAHLYRKLERVLEHEGCRVLRDASQVEAVRHFDLILTQVNRDGGEELAVLKQVKRLHPQVRVVLCTRDGETAFPLEAYQLEADDYLFMPCRLAELRRRVAACLKRTPGKSKDLAAAPWFAPLDGAFLERLKRVFHFIRDNLDSARAALKPLIKATESRGDEKFIAEIHEISARLEVLQEMTDGFTQGISGMEAVTFSLPKKAVDGYPFTPVNRV
jgi:DNA-binding NarL/FixJ family response regulator